MRLVFDLFPCQTASRLRGIGRFTKSLADAMARLRGNHDMYALADGTRPETADALRQDLGSLLPAAHFATYTHTPLAGFHRNSEHDIAVATALVHRAYQAVAPDVVLYSSAFEDESVVALPQGRLPSAFRVAVLYDLIPWLFQAQYLNTPSQKKSYEQRLAALQSFDLLLAISEATRQDAIKILGFRPERIVNISGAASEIFQPAPADEDHDIGRFGIVRPFVLYTGNADYRKNQDGMLRAYAGLPLELRQLHQLVLNQVGDLQTFRRRLFALGLTEAEVVVTGHITDKDLISLYSQCKVFVFPSLYEGFGLPALEAMACGAPVIAANNSSIPEVMGLHDVLFDAASPASISAALDKVLTNDAWRNELASYGIARAKAFSWENTATLAWRAIERGLAAKAAAPAEARKQRIAFVCPLQDGASAHHAAAILPPLARHFDIDLFVEEGTAVDTPLPQDAFNVYAHSLLAERRDEYATVVYQMANDSRHAYMLELMEQFSGVVVSHDVALDAPVHALAERYAEAAVLTDEILYCHGLQGLLGHLKLRGRPSALLLNRHVLESADQLLLLNPAHLDQLRDANPGAWLPPTALLPASDPTACAGAYAKAIHAAIDGSQRHTISNLADALQDAAKDDAALEAIVGHAASNWRLRKQPRLLLDVTQLARSDLGSGIQRVVRNIAYEIAHLDARRPLELVQQKDGKLWRARGVTASLFGISTDTLAEVMPEREVLIQPGDTLLMIDSSWEQYADFAPIFQAVRQLGGKIVTVVYDLIPLRMPEMCIPGLVSVFRAWFRLAVEHSDTLLCISRSVADEARAYLRENKLLPPRKLEVLHWRLGADIAVRAETQEVRPQVRQMADDNHSPLFLMVGTLEPRKGHTFVLEAFEELWRNGSNARLCIAGSVGWIAPETMEHIRTHPQLNKTLFFVEKFTDAEINLCYAAATALIAASVAEGFGLPIVEAAQHQVPTLASDIPVFREVGGDGARYFSLESPHHLAEAVVAFSDMSREDRLAMASRVETLTWRQSAHKLLAAIGIAVDNAV
jgi:glycosyltransferase involved in cell wall biosynthesis